LLFFRLLQKPELYSLCCFKSHMFILSIRAKPRTATAMDGFVEKNKAKKPSDAGSNSRENNGRSVSTVKRAISQLPNLDLSLLPSRHPVGSLPYYTEVNPLHGHSSTCPVPSSPNPNVFRYSRCSSCY
jgi:hypothetical protein